jgi:hypothetical protein
MERYRTEMKPQVENKNEAPRQDGQFGGKREGQ